MRHGLWRLLALALLSATVAAAEQPAPAQLTYERDVRPLLKTHCFACHGEGDELKGGLDLRLRRSMLAGGESGAALAPGEPEKSLIVERITAGEMPPGDKKLEPAQLAIITRWIASGAATAGAEPEKPTDDFTAEERQFWAFQPVTQPALPPVAHADRARTAIDAFLLARLEQQKLSFSPDADKRVLLRRATFDLLGLPPTPEEVDQFLADAAPDAYERLVDRLLASPRYGERWGRHWLDVAGYADSEGYTSEDPVRTHAYKYRDYVVRALNEDMPWDQFIQQQLAGDEMVAPPYEQLAPAALEKLVATGFLRTAPDGTGIKDVDQNVARNQVMADTIKIVSTSLLGLTVGCAQCHNHRYDPISQVDYYRMRAIFEPAYDPQQWLTPQQRMISLFTEADRTRLKEIEAEAVKLDQQRAATRQQHFDRVFERELAKLPADVHESVRAARNVPVDQRTPEQSKLLELYPTVNITDASLATLDPAAADELKQMNERIVALRATKPTEDFVRALTEVPGHQPATHLFNRGDHTQPKQVVEPGELAVLSRPSGSSAPAEGSAVAAVNPVPLDDPALPTTGRRLGYARWLTSGRHPLTARVLMNRFWMHHFGRGIVDTPGNFGVLGARPTHAELLDSLAGDFVAGGWRLKRMHKLIMTSTAYRQASRLDPAAAAVDPDNRLYWRMPPRRLEAEALRDSLLAVSGALNLKMYGPAVPVMEDDVGQIVIGIENKTGEGIPGAVLPLHGEEFRRSIYVQVRRSRPLAMLDTFDLPVMEPNCELRSSSTVAPQSLLLMNGSDVLDLAARFAARLSQAAPGDPAGQVTSAWRLAYSDQPDAQQLQTATAFIAEQTAYFAAHPLKDGNGQLLPGENEPQLKALTLFCQALMTANRFLYID